MVSLVFSASSLGWIFFNNVRNSLPLFIAQSLSINLQTLSYLNTLEDLFEMSYFMYLDSKKIKIEVCSKWYLIVTHWYINTLLKNHVTNSKEAFIYEKRHNIDESLFSEASSSRSLKRPLERWFRKADDFYDFRFKCKISEFVCQVDSCIQGTKIKS